ncbi:MAG: hypothetical protein RL380_1049 [Verrucomicrobiota bacterium]|jgi:hypothetical protein
MPIRLNLLAEAKALEEMRRRDPVKRALWIGAACAGVLILWAGYIQFQIFLAKKQVSSQTTQLTVLQQKFDAITAKKNELIAIEEKFGKLELLHTNRFLWASVLNAVQQACIGEVQVTSLHCDTAYKTVELPPKPGAKITKVSRPETETSIRTSLLIDAKDFGANPGDSVGKFKNSLAANVYFRSLLRSNEVTLRSLSAPTVDGISGKGVVMFSFDCKFPDKVVK